MSADPRKAHIPRIVFLSMVGLTTLRAQVPNEPAENAQGERQGRSRPPFVITAQPPETTAEELAQAKDAALTSQEFQALEEAIVLIQEESYQEAIPLLKSALKRHPTLEPVWEALGWCYIHTDRMDEAETLWRQYLTLRPESPKAHSMLAQLAIQRSDWRMADRYLKGSLKLEPENYDIRYWHAQNLLRLGRLGEALPEFEKLVAVDAYRFDVKIDLARAYTIRQRYEDALDLWVEIIDEIPENLDFRTEFARALLMTGSLEEADAQARAILAEDPTRWPVLGMRADIAEISQSDIQVVETLRALIEDTSTEEQKARLHARLAARYTILHNKNPERWPLSLALEQYAEAIDRIPDNVSWLNQYSGLALMTGKTVEARRVVDHILRDVNPYNRHALRSRFELALLDKDFNAAELILSEMVRRYQPNDPYRFVDRARLEVQQGRYQEALEALDKLEEAGRRGAVFTLLYHGLTESEWVAQTSTRRLEEHLTALRRAGFTFLAPSDIPAYMERNRDDPHPPNPSKPWLARQIDSLRHALTGRHGANAIEAPPPPKVAVVTFDDGQRSSFELGSPIAEDLGVPFGMYIIGIIDELNAPMYAGWEEIRAYHESGLWEIGSHLLDAHIEKPVHPDKETLVYPLPNRIWRPERNRRETMREWTRRVRHEFEGSRDVLVERLGLDPEASLTVAYPYGDIGQEESCNVAHLVNPTRVIATEASRCFDVGFVLDSHGYTCPGDNLMMVRRYEPSWSEPAEEVVRHALENHPVFMARRMRAEIAALMQKPYLAQRQIELLRRDGYPDEALRELTAMVEGSLPNTSAPLPIQEVNRVDGGRDRLQPSDFFVSGSYNENKSNEEILWRFFEGRAGLNLSARLGVTGLYRYGRIDQTVTSNVWYQVRRAETTESHESRTAIGPGGAETTESIVRSTTYRNVQTNRQVRREYEADIAEVGLSLSFRVSDQATLFGSLGQKTLTFRDRDTGAHDDDSELVGSLSVAWRPYRPLQLVAAYQHDLVPSARRLISYDAFALDTRWLISDEWEVGCNARYWNYDDDNAMVFLGGDTFWLMFARQGIWGGLEISTHSADDASDYYWTPYWDNRFAGVLRFKRAYEGYFFQFDARLGWQNEKGRPEDRLAYRQLKAQADADGNWYPGEDPDVDRDMFVGIGCTYRQRWIDELEGFASLNVNFLRDYSEHTFTLGLQANF